MQTFKKIVFPTLIILLIICVVSVIIIEPMIKNEAGYYLDANSRDSIAGKIDSIFIGDSDGMTAFVPDTYDSRTGQFSYNLSGTMMTTGSEYALLKKELSRNAVKKVYLQVSYEFFSRNPEKEHGDGDSVTIQRLDVLSEKLSFLFQHVKLDNWLDVYSRLLVSGMSYWKAVLTHSQIEYCDWALKGWRCVKKGNDQSIAPENIEESHNIEKISTEFKFDHAGGLEEVISMCKSYGAEVILIITPVSDAHIWEYDNWDAFREWIENYSEANQVRCYDFNLYKEKYQRLNDRESFKDYAHMSEQGAIAYTNMLVDVELASQNELDLNNLFYNTYTEMKMDSPYLN